MKTPRAANVIFGAGAGLVVVLVGILGVDLYYAIPWWVRKSVGWVAFAALLAVLTRRLLQVQPGDNPVPEDAGRNAPWWLGWVGLIAVTTLGVPLLQHPENLGFGDWDLFLGKYEAARRTIALYGQFPWWDPWTRGGFPLAANPQCGVWGVAMPLVLLFGTSVGMRLATLVCFLLAFEGMRRLARLWLGDPVAAVFAALIYALNGGVLVAAVAAYHVSMCYPALPWMLYFVFKLEQRQRNGLWLGFWAAFNLLNGIQYFTVYTVLILAVVWLRRLAVIWVTRRGELGRFLTHSVLAFGVFLALAGWRLVTTGVVYHDFPRVYYSGFDETPWKILTHLLGRPSAATLARLEVPYFWETTCYIGPVVLVLAAISLRGGWRWWHTLAGVCGWLAAGSVAWYHPSYWLAHFPAFSTMHAVPRWRFMAMLGVALAAASVVTNWYRDGRRSRRWLAHLAIIAVSADYIAYGFEVLPVAFSIPPTESRFPGPELPAGSMVQIDEWPGFAAISRGYGVIHGFEPLLGYDRQAPTARHWRGGLDDHGEAWTDEGPAQVIRWTPNQVVLQVQPSQRVYLNQNPGSWWWLNGRPAFPEWRVAEKDRPFAVLADDQGRVELKIYPKGLRWGVLTHSAGVVLTVGAWLSARRLHPRIRDKIVSVTT